MFWFTENDVRLAQSGFIPIKSPYISWVFNKFHSRQMVQHSYIYTHKKYIAIQSSLLLLITNDHEATQDFCFHPRLWKCKCCTRNNQIFPALSANVLAKCLDNNALSFNNKYTSAWIPYDVTQKITSFVLYTWHEMEFQRSFATISVYVACWLSSVWLKRCAAMSWKSGSAFLYQCFRWELSFFSPKKHLLKTGDRRQTKPYIVIYILLRIMEPKYVYQVRIQITFRRILAYFLERKFYKQQSVLLGDARVVPLSAIHQERLSKTLSKLTIQKQPHSHRFGCLGIS